MHIIAGQYKNRKLISPKGDAVRPSVAALRKSVFDICRESIVDGLFLDLFAGSGAMALEALSRGAKHATMIESEKGSLYAIHRNVELLHVEGQVTVYSGDVFHKLPLLKKFKKQYDVIFVDPPYKAEKDEKSYAEVVLALLDGPDLLCKDGHLFIEHASEVSLEAVALQTLFLKSRRRIGRAMLSEYSR